MGQPEHNSHGFVAQLPCSSATHAPCRERRNNDRVELVEQESDRLPVQLVDEIADLPAKPTNGKRQAALASFVSFGAPRNQSVEMQEKTNDSLLGLVANFSETVRREKGLKRSDARIQGCRSALIFSLFLNGNPERNGQEPCSVFPDESGIPMLLGKQFSRHEDTGNPRVDSNIFAFSLHRRCGNEAGLFW